MTSSAIPSAGALSALLSSFTWAAGVSVYTLLAKRYPAYKIHWSRVLVAWPFFIVLILAQNRFDASAVFEEIRKLRGSNLLWASLSSVSSFALGDVLFLWSTVALGAPAALAIASTYPFWSALAGFLFRGESISPLRAAGLFLAVAGTVIVILAGYRHHRKNLVDARSQKLPAAKRKLFLENYAVGIFLAFSTSLAWALNTYAGMKSAQGVLTSVANAARMGIALALCPLAGALITRGMPAPLPLKEFRRYGPVFAVEAFLGSTFFLYGLANAPLAVASALSSLAPVLAVPIGLAAGTEKFSFTKTMGVAMVVAGIAFLV